MLSPSDFRFCEEIVPCLLVQASELSYLACLLDLYLSQIMLLDNLQTADFISLIY